MPSLLSSAVSYALENVGAIAALVIFASVVAWAAVTVDDWLEGDHTQGVSLQYQPGLISGYGDLSATAPTLITYGDAPDTTRTECFQAPIWLDRLRSQSQLTQSEPSRDSLRSRPRFDESSPTSDSEPPTSTRLRTELRGLPYVITPMTQGRPALSVGSDEVVLQSLSPRDGRPLEFTYPILRPSNRLSAVSEAILMPQTAGLLAGGQYAHRWTDVPLLSSLTAEWTAGYAVTTEGAGPAGRLSLKADVTW